MMHTALLSLIHINRAQSSIPIGSVSVCIWFGLQGSVVCRIESRLFIMGGDLHCLINEQWLYILILVPDIHLCFGLMFNSENLRVYIKDPWILRKKQISIYIHLLYLRNISFLSFHCRQVLYFGNSKNIPCLKLTALIFPI